MSERQELGDVGRRVADRVRGARLVRRARRHPGRQMLWGLLLIAVGVVFLLDRWGTIQIGEFWELWPAVFFVIGTGHLLFPDSPAERVHALGMYVLGLWFFACQNNWWGLSYGNSWPILVASVGLQIVLRALIESRARPDEGEVRP